MTATNREYERYLGWLSTQDDISADIKRVANIIYNHFDEIECTTTAQSQRSKILTPYLLDEIDRTAETLSAIEGNRSETEAQWVRLRRLVVGTFQRVPTTRNVRAR